MNLLCLWRQRTLAKAAVSEGSLAEHPRLKEHLRRCAACRRCWQDLQSLTGELASIAEPLPSGDGMTNAVWARIALAPIPARRGGRLVPVAVAVACTAFGFVLWNRLANAPATTARLMAAEQAGKAVSEKVAIDTAIKTTVSETQKTPVKTENPGKRITSATADKKRVVQNVQARKRRWKRTEIRRMAQRSHRPEVRVVRKQRSRHLQHRTKQVATVLPTPVRWQAWGVYYESQGDYERAAAAYGKAYAEQPDPATAFAAGQAAESAGDVTQALVYYSQLLKSSSEKKEPQKGTLLWSHENTSA